MKSRLMSFWAIVLLVITNILGAKLGELLVIPPGNISAIWPPAGFAFAALFVLGEWVWPGVFIASFLYNTHFLIQKTGSFSWSIVVLSLCIAFGSVAQAFVAKRFADFFLTRDIGKWSFINFIKTLFFAGPAASVIAAFFGVLVLWIGHYVPDQAVFLAWITWWFGDSVGVFIFGGILLGLYYFLSVRKQSRFKSRMRYTEIFSVITVFCCIGLTLFSWKMLQNMSEKNNARRFAHLAKESTMVFRGQLNACEEVLRSAAGFINASKHIEPEEWETFVTALALEKRQSGLYGLGFIVPVQTTNLSRYVSSLQPQLGPDFSVKSIHKNPLNEHFIIQYISPLYKNKAAFGLDLGSETFRREAALLSRQNNQPYLTKPIVLVQDKQSKIGYLLLYPVFHKKEFKGWVYFPFSGESLFEDLEKKITPELVFSVYDTSSGRDQLVYSNAQTLHHHFSRSRTVEITTFNAHWKLVWYASPMFMPSYLENQSAWILIFGLVLTVLLVMLLVTFGTIQLKAEALAKQATVELEEVNARLNSLVEHAVDSIISIDKNDNITLWNPASEQMFGYTAEEVMGKNVIDFVIPPQIRRPDLFANRKGLVLHKLLIRNGYKKNGQIFPIELSFFMVGEGEHMYLTSFTRDISERVKMEQELRWAKHNAEKSDRAKSEFLAMMSHEIRTPMNGIVGMADVLSKTNLTDKQQEYVDIIIHSSKSLLTIINDILDFSKIEAGKLELHNAPFLLNTILKELTDLLGFEIQKKQLEFSMDNTYTFHGQLMGDSDRLRQILLNLLSNAIKFTEKGSITVSVSAKEETDTRVTLLFSVKDTGIGLKTDQKKRILQPFSQADTSISRRYGGTGLGLVICKQLSHLFGGELGFESEWQKGSHFFFTAVFEKIQEEKAVITPDIPTATEKTGLHILLAEDNPINQMITKTMLEELGHTVEVACNGAEAVTAAYQRDFDVILMDVQMPEMDGLDAARHIRKFEGPKGAVHIIALSANVLKEDQNEALATGMNAYLTKPFTMQDLKNILT